MFPLQQAEEASMLMLQRIKKDGKDNGRGPIAALDLEPAAEDVLGLSSGIAQVGASYIALSFILYPALCRKPSQTPFAQHPKPLCKGMPQDNLLMLSLQP